MPTQPMFDDPWSKFEFTARVQMELTDDWTLESSATAIKGGLEEQIDALEFDEELDDRERWQALNTDKVPLAWLPKGMLLVTMRRETEGEIEKKAGFIHVD